ncbi:MAG: glycoside hydrolase family 3 N-terminal domain-containing protein [Breoghania sp.]|nr:glycoside hydrolase family 3 N-terminal domain-containing protein [Breoghania sp.]MDJ0929629.1 glycoside hydrolase family 3 N-terminal domain-containing protein [Breoghania sp.]
MFGHNVSEPAQVADLVAAFRDAVGYADAPVLIDQEGGRVQRLKPPHWSSYPPGRHYGQLFAVDAQAGKRAAWLGVRLIAHDLHALGITVDCLPVLDVPAKSGHDVIGDRAYGEDVETVVTLAGLWPKVWLWAAFCRSPSMCRGRGWAGADSYLELPRVDTPAVDLEAVDFEPFRRLSGLPLAMTAHVVYTAYDALNPATTSKRMIDDVIRGIIGFDGCLMSDDLSMQALAGALGDRAQVAFDAGCDLALHCNGDMAEMTEVAARSPELTGAPLRRAKAALDARSEPKPLDEQAAREELRALLARLADR